MYTTWSMIEVLTITQDSNVMLELVEERPLQAKTQHRSQPVPPSLVLRYIVRKPGVSEVEKRMTPLWHGKRFSI